MRARAAPRACTADPRTVRASKMSATVIIRTSSGICSAGQPVRVAAAVELLVVAVGERRHARQPLGPRDREQELVGVHDVRLDLASLHLVEGTLGHRQRPRLLRQQQRRLAAVPVPERQPLEVRDQHGGRSLASSAGSLAASTAARFASSSAFTSATAASHAARSSAAGTRPCPASAASRRRSSTHLVRARPRGGTVPGRARGGPGGASSPWSAPPRGPRPCRSRAAGAA